MELAAATGATAAVAAYLSGKFHLQKDLRGLWIRRQAEKHAVKRINDDRASLWYSFEDATQNASPYQRALWSREGSYTFNETYGYACRYGQLIVSHGITKNEAVSLFMTNSPDMVFAWLGAWAAGCHPALINYNISGEGLIHCLKLSKSKIVLVDEDSEVCARMNEVRHRVENELGITVIVVDTSFKRKLREMTTIRIGDDRRRGLKEGDPCMTLFTSGTTGFPKAVRLSNGRVMRSNRARVPGVGFPGGADARVYVCMPMYHGTGGILALMCMTEGLTLSIGKRFSARTFWDDIRDSGSQSFVYVGETLRYLLAAPKSPRDKENPVQLIFGNGLRPDVWIPFRDRFGIDTVVEFFSSTEGIFELLNSTRGDFSAGAVGHHGLIARALWSRVLGCAKTSDENTKDLYRDPKTGFCQQMPLNVGGEMLVKVPGKAPQESGFAGYLENTKATDEKFISDVFVKGDLYYRTGDALRRDDDGRWYFLDRLGDTFRWKSENVSTAEVAEAVGTFPGVQEANVYGVLVPGHDGRAGCAAVYIAGGIEGANKFDWKGLVAHLRARLPRYAVPIFIRILKGEIKAGMHNMKQNKVVLRNEGCDAKKVDDSGDRMLFLPPGKDAYEEYTSAHWAAANEKALKL